MGFSDNLLTKLDSLELGKMKIVLVRPNFDGHTISPPLGLGYLSSYLKKQGVEAVIIDGLRENLGLDKIVERILSERPDAVGISCVTAYYKEVVALSRELKRNKLRVIVGGFHPTFLPYETLVDSKADFVICGEAEIALAKLAKKKFVNTDIKGVYSLRNLSAKTRRVEKAEIVERLDELPFPDWAQMDPREYPIAVHGLFVKNYPVGVIVSSRGCPCECSFCANPSFYDRKIRFRSPENVVSEIKYLVENFGVREIHFEDDNFACNKEHAKRICELIIKNKLEISWACPNGFRADTMDEELLRLMKRSGCYYIALGIESADETVLKNVKKRESVSVMRRAIEIAERVGIPCQGFFIFGLPGETERTIKKTIDFALGSGLSRAQFQTFDVLPGSWLWEELKGRIEPNLDKKRFREPEYVYVRKGLSPEKLISAQRAAFWRFYSRPRIFWGMIRMMRPRQLRFLIKRIFESRVI